MIRVPKHTLAEGAPLPGGGGVTGASRPSATQKAAVTPALEKMREYYGTSPAEERARGASEPAAAGAPSSDPGASLPVAPGRAGPRQQRVDAETRGKRRERRRARRGGLNANANASATTSAPPPQRRRVGTGRR